MDKWLRVRVRDKVKVRVRARARECIIYSTSVLSFFSHKAYQCVPGALPPRRAPGYMWLLTMAFVTFILYGLRVAWYPARRKSAWYTQMRFRLIKNGVAHAYDVYTV